MEYFKASIIFIVSALITIFGYFEAIAFSSSLSMPDFILEYSETTGNPGNVYYWSFIVVTLNLPFAVIVGLLGFFSGKLTKIWVATLAIVAVLIYFQGLSLGIAHWWSVFIMSIFSSLVFAVVGQRSRSKVNHNGPV